MRCSAPAWGISPHTARRWCGPMMGAMIGGRFALAVCSLVAVCALPGCEPQICTTVQAALGAPGCGEEANFNSPPEIGALRIDDFSPAVGQEVRFSVPARDVDGDDLYYEWDLD